MYPILFKIGPIAIYSWGAAFCVSILVGVAVSMKRAARHGVPQKAVRDLATVILITSLVGSRVWYIVYHLDKHQGHWADLFLTGKGSVVGCSGLSMMGGVVLALLASLIFARIMHIRFLALGDVIAPAFLLGSGIQRLGGCLLSGCCYGLPTESILGMTFPKGGDAGAHFPGIPLWPAQLIASALGFAGYALILTLDRRHRFPGFTFCLVFMYYALERFLVDQIRYYQPAEILGSFGPITLNVNHPIILALFILSTTLWLLCWLRSSSAAQE